MSISKIRIGNQISLQWTIKQGDSAYDLSAKQNKVYLIAPMARYEVNNFTLSGNSHNIINITWRGVEQHYCGEYHLLLVSVGSNGENMFSIDSKPCFILTPVTDQSAASTATTVQLTDNIMMPSSGESLYEMMVRNGLFEGTEAEFLQEYEDKLDACETATDAANDAATDADTAAGNAITAAATANSAATNANTKAQLAQTKADLADSAATNANTKADAAHTAAVEAASAAELAETKAGLANSAASSASSAASAATSAAQSATTAASTANSKAQLAQTKADLANSAAESATSAASSATSAASSATSAASSANTAAAAAGNVNATLNGTNLTITDRDGHSTTVNTKGDPGEVTEEEFTQLAHQVSGNTSDIEAIPFSYMAGARVGTSDDLTPDNVATSETIKERIAGGTQTIKQGSALVERVKGNSLVWNQLVDSVINQSRTINGLSLVLSNGNLTITGTASQDTDLIIVDATNQVKGWVRGHKVISLLSSPINNSNLRDSYSSVTGNNTCIVYTSASIYYNLRVDVSAGTTLNYSGKLQLHDLTQMFGAGNEPTTLAEFEARCPKVANPYAYNAGTIVGMTAEGIATTDADGNPLSKRTWGNILASAFGGTMHAVGSVYDEIGLRKAVKRVTTYAFKGTEAFVQAAEGIYAIEVGILGAKPNTPKVCNMYPSTDAAGDGRGVYSSTLNVVFVDSAYTTLSAWKSHLAELYSAGNPLVIVYELATPVETTYDELAMTYKATPNGMESMVAEGASAPLKADIIYPINAQGSIRNNSTAIGTLANLATTAKTDLVSAINELYNMISNG